MEWAFSTGTEFKHKTFFTNVGGSGDGNLHIQGSGIREEEFFRNLGVSSFGSGQCLGPLRVGLGRQLRESVS